MPPLAGSRLGSVERWGLEKWHRTPEPPEKAARSGRTARAHTRARAHTPYTHLELGEGERRTEASVLK